jgi:hypothetical protein
MEDSERPEEMGWSKQHFGVEMKIAAKWNFVAFITERQRARGVAESIATVLIRENTRLEGPLEFFWLS